jgi:hypothetical protein
MRPFITGSFQEGLWNTRKSMERTEINLIMWKGYGGEDAYQYILANPSKRGLTKNTP